MKTLYSVPGAVCENGLESRLRAILNRGQRLPPRIAVALATTALGVTLPVLAVRPHVVSDSSELVKQAHESVTLPGGTRVRMLGFQAWDQKLQRRFWSTEGQPIPVPYFPNETYGGLPGLITVIEVQTLADSDVTVSGAMVVYDSLQKARRYVAYNPVGKATSVRVGQGRWIVAATFDPLGKPLSGHSVRLRWGGVVMFRNVDTWFSEDTLPDTDSRLVALDSAGREYVIRHTRYSQAGKGIPHQVSYSPVKLWPIAKDKIVGYRYETRPWTQIRFEGWKAPKDTTL